MSRARKSRGLSQSSLSPDVWYSCHLRASETCAANNRNTYVSSPLVLPNVNLNVVFLWAANPRVELRPLFAGSFYLGADLACGFTGFAVDYAIGLVGEISLKNSRLLRVFCATRVMASPQYVRAYVYEPKGFVTMVLILIFTEVLGCMGAWSPLLPMPQFDVWRQVDRGIDRLITQRAQGWNVNGYVQRLPHLRAAFKQS
jgi:F0F1-type ATP synthase membrane subunit c/vacuolar-type H+-ATPase subunit K